MKGFIWQHRVAFGDCDPARIAYTGRLADFALDAIDAFWDDLLEGEGWFHMNTEAGYGMPFVRMEFDFSAPVTPKEPLICHVRPEQLGRTSVTLGVDGWQGERMCFRARFVSVFVRLDGMEKMLPPARVRAALMERYRSVAGTNWT